MVLKPFCRHCVAEVQLFKRCRNLSASTVLQRCSCISVVKTSLPALCCRGASVYVVSKPICWHCVAEVQLFKRCGNLSAGTVLQRCSCLSSVATLLLGTVLQGAAVYTVSQPICRYSAARVQLIKLCQNLAVGTVLQGCSCLSGVETYLLGTMLQGCSCFIGVETYLPALCCRGAAV